MIGTYRDQLGDQEVNKGDVIEVTTVDGAERIVGRDADGLEAKIVPGGRIKSEPGQTRTGYFAGHDDRGITISGVRPTGSPNEKREQTYIEGRAIYEINNKDK